jgi:hypothetical protein
MKLMINTKKERTTIVVRSFYSLVDFYFNTFTTFLPLTPLTPPPPWTPLPQR